MAGAEPPAAAAEYGGLARNPRRAPAPPPRGRVGESGDRARREGGESGEPRNKEALKAVAAGLNERGASPNAKDHSREGAGAKRGEGELEREPGRSRGAHDGVKRPHGQRGGEVQGVGVAVQRAEAYQQPAAAAREESSLAGGEGAQLPSPAGEGEAEGGRRGSGRRGERGEARDEQEGRAEGPEGGGARRALSTAEGRRGAGQRRVPGGERSGGGPAERSQQEVGELSHLNDAATVQGTQAAVAAIPRASRPQRSRSEWPRQLAGEETAAVKKFAPSM